MLAGLPAVQARHHDVQYDDVGALLDGLDDGGATVARGDHLITRVLQHEGEQLDDARVVVDDQHLSRRRFFIGAGFGRVHC